MLSFISAGYAQSISVQVDNLVKTGENFNVTFVFENCTPSDFSWDAGEDLQIVWGPQKGSSSRSTNINGKRTHSSSVTYSFIVSTKREGVLTIPPATAKVDGKQMSSAAKTIESVGAARSVDQSGVSSYSESSNSEAELFLQYELSTSRAVIGEPITATLCLYKKGTLNSIDEFKMAPLNGFWSQEEPTSSNIQFSRRKYKGDLYDAAVLRSYTLIPQQSGDLVIEPAEITCGFLIRSGRAPSSVFEAMMDDGYTRLQKTAKSPQVVLHVEALPAGAPASFGGGVGSFSMGVKVSRDSLAAHDAASLTVSLTGRGNVSLLEAPKVNFPPDFDVYDTKIEDKSSRLSGTKTFEFPFIPRSHGEFDIPAIEYSYYDVNAGKYVTMNSSPIHISVSKPSRSEEYSGTPQTIVVPSSKDVRTLDTDIDYIETGRISLVRKGEFFLFSPLFFAVALAAVLIAVVAFFVLRRRAARRADVVGQKSRRATKVARKRLSAAKTFLSAGNGTEFYEELHRALLCFVSDKLVMDMSAMSKDSIQDALCQGGIDPAAASDYVTLIDSCEFARYSPDGAASRKESDYESALQLISMIDDRYKKPTGKHRTASSMLIALLLALPFGLSAANTSDEELWAAGNEAYKAGQWEDAMINWKALDARNMESAALYTNIADAYYRLGDDAHAVLYYERALRLDESYAPSVRNLSLVRQNLLDKIEPTPQGAMSKLLHSSAWLLSSDAWAVFGLVLFVCAVLCALVFFIGGSRGRRKLGFFAALASLLLMAISLSFSYIRMKDYQKKDSAVVVSAVVAVKSAPGDAESSKDKFVLHEGTKVKILRQENGWICIEIEDGRDGWIHSEDAEII